MQNHNHGHNHKELDHIHDCLDSVKSSLPLLKQLPEKVSDLQFSIQDLTDRMVKNYVTYSQTEETMALALKQYEQKEARKFEEFKQKMMKELNEVKEI